MEPSYMSAMQPQQSDREMVELFFSCRGLPNLDVTSKSDPQLVLYTADDRGQWTEVGKTEVMRENLNPNFVKSFQVSFIFEKKQTLKVEVRDVDSATTFDYIGETTATLGQWVGARAGTTVMDLTNRHKNGEKAGKVIVRVEKVAKSNDFITMKWKAYNLKDLGGWFSKSSPFMLFSRQRTDQTWLPVHQTEFIKENLNPNWAQFNLSAQKLCNGNYDVPMKIEVFAHHKDGDHKLIGTLPFTFRNFIQGNREFALMDPSNKSAGKLILENFVVETRPDFLDYIRGGTQINVICAVDFTASNGLPTTPASLHRIAPGQRNQYQTAMQKVCEILLNYDYDKKVPMFGFGARPRFPNFNTGETLHCFSMTGDQGNPEVYNLDGIMNCYANAVQHVELNGPTYFGPLLQESSKLAAMFKQTGSDVYTVLLILTDGEIHDMQVSIDALVAATHIPLSVIIIGVGNADFTNMEILDGDSGLVNSSGVKAQRDCCQFVPFNKFQNDPTRLSEEVLAELPAQLCTYKRFVGQAPNAPQRVDINAMNASVDLSKYVQAAPPVQSQSFVAPPPAGPR